MTPQEQRDAARTMVLTSGRGMDALIEEYLKEAAVAYRPADVDAIATLIDTATITVEWDDEPHIIEFREDGWTIQHPLACRPRLFDCEINRVGETLPGPLAGRLGRFECAMADGRLAIGEQVGGESNG